MRDMEKIYLQRIENNRSKILIFFIIYNSSYKKKKTIRLKIKLKKKIK